MDQGTLTFEEFSADRLRRDSDQITRQWVERISSRLGIRPRRVLPHADLLDHVPEVLATAAEFIVTPDPEKLTAERGIMDEMREIARLRRRQGYDVQEIIREFDELAQVLDGEAMEWLEEYPGSPDPGAVGRVFGRLNRAPLLMGEVTLGTYQEEELNSRYAVARQLRDFSEVLMHQLKTPLGAAEGAALLLENEEITADPDERRRFATLIRRNLSRARSTIDDVRALALAQLAHTREGRRLPIGVVLGEVLAEIRELVQQKGVRIEIEEPIPPLIVDASRVEIVLLNLIGNAAKYADPAKRDRWVRIAFAAAEGEEGCWIQVSDNGLGIPPEIHGRIFERFFRGHPDAAEGSGLGLAIAREAVRQLDGRLEFDSQPGSGSTFRFLVHADGADTGGEGDAEQEGAEED